MALTSPELRLGFPRRDNGGAVTRQPPPGSWLLVVCSSKPRASLWPAGATGSNAYLGNRSQKQYLNNSIHRARLFDFTEREAKPKQSCTCASARHWHESNAVPICRHPAISLSLGLFFLRFLLHFPSCHIPPSFHSSQFLASSSIR